jgi:hypothetical protein
MFRIFGFFKGQPTDYGDACRSGRDEMKTRRFFVGSIAAAGLILTLAANRPQPQPVRFTFEETTEGWTGVPPPAGAEISLSLTDDTAQAKAGKHALKARYRMEPRKLPGLVHPVGGLAGRGVRVWLKTDTAATLVLGLIERDGSAYMHVVQTLPGEWLRVEAPFTSFHLSEDSKDENGRLDLEQVGTLVIADAGGFMPGAGGERALWVDEYEVTGDIRTPEPKPYRPLLETGRPSASGARATAGVTYRPGKFGAGVLTDAPGELAAVPVRGRGQEKGGWQWEQGTIELWISPQFDMARVRDYAGLVAMQEEPFITGFRGSLLVFYTRTRQIAFMLNGRQENVLATAPLAWKAEEWHHLAVSWGERGMRLSLDGRAVAQNRFAGSPGIPAADVVVGNHAWTILSNRFANTVIDELRLSQRQRTDEEIAAAAKATAPFKPDTDTLSLEHFDGQPLPPIRLRPDAAPFHAVSAGSPVQWTAAAPGEPNAGARLVYTISTPGGTVVRTGAVPLKRSADARQAAASIALTLNPFQTPGFYRITFRLEKGGAVINEGADWFRVVHPLSRPPYPSLLFGASGCFADPQAREEFFRRAAAAGIRSLRMPFEWAEIEPRENVFVWDKYDRIVRWANRYGVELVPTFLWENPQPEWAGRGNVQNEQFNTEHYPPEDLAKWSAFVYQVVSRYKGRIRWWIPANEPNLSKYWHPKPDAKAYVALLKATWQAARRADPQAKILGCSAAGMDLRFLEECFKAGALAYCDAVGTHPYICPHSPDERIPINILDPASPTGTFREGLLAAKALIARYGGKQKLWLDEAGQPYRDDFIAPNWGVSEEKAAGYLAKIYVEALASGAVERVLWFSFWGSDYGSFAMLQPDGSPTLPLTACAAAAERLSGARLMERGERGEGVRSVVFQQGRREIEVVWSLEGEREVKLRPGEQAWDLFGFPLRQANAARRLRLSARPVYLERARAR